MDDYVRKVIDAQESGRDTLILADYFGYGPMLFCVFDSNSGGDIVATFSPTGHIEIEAAADLVVSCADLEGLAAMGQEANQIWARMEKYKSGYDWVNWQHMIAEVEALYITND